MNLQQQNSNRKSTVQGGPSINSFTGMGPKEVSLLSVGHKKSGRWWKLLLLILAVVIVGAVSVVTLRAASLSRRIFVGQKTSFVQKVRDLLLGSHGGIQLRGQNEGQINILLLGIGGEGHEGPYLTDTMILLQIRPQQSEVVLTSIPRDYLVNLPNNLGQRKINSAFAEGFNTNKNFDTAGAWARQVVQDISGLQIPYFAVIDFSGFEKAIDTIGGVDVTIDRTFTDYSYPNENYGYLPPVTFKEGTEHMNGTRALEFARSRHAEGFEGSDFARSLRQQKVINSFKDKVFTLNLISDSGKINKLLDIFADHFHTNMSPGEIYTLYQTIKNQNVHNFLSLSLDPDTKLICPEILPENGAYVLVPCPGKTSTDIKNFFKNSFARARLSEEKSIVWLGSSTGDAAALQKAQAVLQNQGLTAYQISYSKDNLPKSVFYMVNPKPATAEFLTNEFGASEVTLPPPQVKIDKTKVDVILILGQDYTASTNIIREP